MEMPGSESFSEADQTLSQLPPKKRPSDRAKSVDDEPSENGNLQTNSNSSGSSKITLIAAQPPQNIDSQNQPKACIDQEAQNVGLNGESKGESSKSPSLPPVPLASPPSQCPKACIDQEPQNVGLNEESREESSKSPSSPVPLASPPSQHPITSIDQEPQQVGLDEESQGESSKSPSPPAAGLAATLSLRTISCKFCDQKFATTQALGGHQNAHKKEREVQKAMEAANDLRLNSLPGILSRPLRGSLLGRRHPYHPYNGYGQGAGVQGRSVYSHPNTGNAQGPTSVTQTIQDYMGGTSIKPANASFHGWTARYAPPIGPIGRFNGPIYFNPGAGAGSSSTSFLQPASSTSFLQPASATPFLQPASAASFLQPASSTFVLQPATNFLQPATSFLQPMTNLANLAQQSMESTALGLSLKCNEFGKMDFPPNSDDHLKFELPTTQNESTDLDLDLKL